MVTQEDIHHLMEQNHDNPELTEAAYLAAKYLKAEQINRNLRIRYGSGQGLAQFKNAIIEITVYYSITSETNSYGAQFEMVSGDESQRIDRITVEDVDIDLDKVIRDAYKEEVASRFEEEIQENLSLLSQEASIIAYITRRGHDLGVWETRDEPDANQVWNLFSITTGETLSDPMKTDILEELVERGCIYVDNDDIILTPPFTRLEDPYDQLPQLEVNPSPDIS